jgi:hypothetical protein
MSIDIREEADPNYRQNIDRYVIPSTPTPTTQDPNFQIIRLVVASVDDTDMDPYGELQDMLDDPSWYQPDDFEYAREKCRLYTPHAHFMPELRSVHLALQGFQSMSPRLTAAKLKDALDEAAANLDPSAPDKLSFTTLVSAIEDSYMNPYGEPSRALLFEAFVEIIERALRRLSSEPIEIEFAFSELASGHDNNHCILNKRVLGKQLMSPGGSTPGPWFADSAGTLLSYLQSNGQFPREIFIDIKYRRLK